MTYEYSSQALNTDKAEKQKYLWVLSLVVAQGQGECKYTIIP